MGHRLSGVETEYACTMLLGGVVRPAPELLLDAAKRRHLYLTASEGGIFVANGGRFYIDSGAHPEFSSPEVTTPWDTCRYIKAGDRILVNSAQEAMRNTPGLEVMINRGNICYSADSPVTWACHESICHQIEDQNTLRHQLVPHLVSRQIFTGGGGFDNRRPGLRFMLSPRVAHLQRQAGSATQNERPVFHTKEEPLCDNFQRLHIICGETVCSELSQWLKSATTVLVVTLIEMGVCPHGLLDGVSPLAAMRRMGRDETLTIRASRGLESSLTALQMQRAYLQAAEQHLRDPRMPDWAEEACHRWRDILERLEQGAPDTVATSLDWAIKYKIYRQFLEQQGIRWDDLPIWNSVVSKIAESGADAAGENKGGEKKADERKQLLAYLTKHRLSWSDLPTFEMAQQKLFELDTRFGLLGGNGLFDILDGQGVLEHHVEGVENIAQAIDHPPGGATRARARSQTILKLQQRRESFQCQWNGVYGDQQHFRFPDPYSAEVVEEAPLEDQPAAPAQPWLLPDILCDARHRGQLCASRAEHHLQRGNYREALEVLNRLDPLEADLENRARLLRLGATIQTRLGRVAEHLLEGVSYAEPDDLQSVCDRLEVYRFSRLIPNVERMRPFVELGDQICRRQDRPYPGDFREHKAVCALFAGQADEARAILSVVNLDSAGFFETAARARALATSGEANRRLGRRARARRLLQHAEMIQRAHRLFADLATLTLPMLAKLTLSDQIRRRYLREALHICQGQDPLGEVRIRVLQARILSTSSSESDEHRNRIETLRETSPLVTACPSLRHILNHWDNWVHGPIPVDDPDGFWNV